MSETTQAAAQEQSGGAPAAPPPVKPAIMVAVLAAAAIAGVGGGFVLAPRLAPAAGQVEAAAEEGAGHGDESGGGGHGGGRIFRIDNLIVNPAGSEGTRFLMTTVAFEVENEALEAQLRQRDVQVRDLVVSRLESQTMATLTRPFARDSIKRELAQAVTEVLGPKARVRVYLPQFVIQ